ncbi:MAG TPA: hypothetical protein VGL83_18165 [Stellaceae bacterium]|jgi:hypothetical protein
MSDAPSDPPFPITCHILLRAAGDADFRRAGAARLEALPARGAVIEVRCEGRRLRGTVEAVIIPPGCEENCVGTVFLAEN